MDQARKAERLKAERVLVRNRQLTWNRYSTKITETREYGMIKSHHVNKSKVSISNGNGTYCI